MFRTRKRGRVSCTQHCLFLTNLFAVVTLQQIRQLQKAAEGHQQEVAVMHDCMAQIMTELTTLGRVADAAAASIHYGTDQNESVAKMSSLHDRMQVLQQVSQKSLQS